MEPFNREAGIQALIDLGRLSGVAVTREQAAADWDRFSWGAQQQTMEAWNFLIGKKHAA
jgi:hypothetical protein